VALEAPDAGADAMTADAQAPLVDAPDASITADVSIAADAFMPDAFLVIPDGCVPAEYWNDNDADGFGDDSMPSILACALPANYVTNNRDCNDASEAVYPGADEICNLVDDNCDGSIDELVQVTVYRDNDDDAFGSVETSLQCPGTSGWASVSGDCNDSNSRVSPGAAEACNGIDDNCNGSVDELLLATLFRDLDADGFGTSPGMQCPGTMGWAALSGDCDDANRNVYPGAREVCNGIDDNCVMGIDEMLLSVFYEDRDMDGYGVLPSAAMCTAPPGYVARAGDCNDANRDISPMAPEVCNGIDDNCARGPDDTFACVLGRSYMCPTSCGTTGSYVCPAGCAIPACTPPVEACNYADDDCDDYIDEGASTWRGPTTAEVSNRRVELLTTSTGFVRVLARSTGVWARNYDRRGAPIGVETRLTSTAPSVFAASVHNDSLYLATYDGSRLWGHEFSATTLAPRVTNVSVAGDLGALTAFRLVASENRLFIFYANPKLEAMVRDRAWGGSGVLRIDVTPLDFDVALGEDPTQVYLAASIGNGVELRRVSEAGTDVLLTRHRTVASARFAQVAIGKMAGGRNAVGLAFHDNAGLGSNVRFALYEADSLTTVAPRGELSLEAITPSFGGLDGSMDLTFSGGRFTAAWLTISGTDWHIGDIRPIIGAPTGVLTTIPLGPATTSMALASGEDGRILAIHGQASAAARTWFRGCM